MTSAQVKHIVNDILIDEAAENGYSALLQNFMIVINKDELLYTDINRWRYKFDYTNNLIERILVEPHKYDSLEVLDPKKSDTYTDKNGVITTYKYKTDKNGNVIKDVYMMSSIIMFVPQPEVIL